MPICLIMKKTLFLTLFFLNYNLVFAQNKCDSSASKGLGSIKEAEKNILDKSCEDIDRKASCSERKTDPDAQRRLITNMLNYTSRPEAKKKLLSGDLKLVQYYGGYQKEYIKRNPPVDPVPLLDWFGEPQFSGVSFNQQELKQKFIDKFVQFSKNYDCEPKINSDSAVVIKHPGIPAEYFDSSAKKTKAYSKVAQAMKDPANIKIINDEVNRINSQAMDSFLVCRNAPDELQVAYHVRELYGPCTGSLTNYFADNVYKISDKQLSSLLDDQVSNDLASCIKDRMDKGATIHHISISASSSSLNNTVQYIKDPNDSSKVIDIVCKKGFEKLSELRAQSAQTQVLPELFKKAGQSDLGLKSKVIVSVAGSNGNGTSGPCVYEMVNGKEQLKAEYRTEKGQKSLDEHKYVNVHVTFNEPTKSIPDKKEFYQPTYRCKKIKLSCG